MRVAAIKDGVVTSVVIAPDGMSADDYGRWAAAMALATQSDAMRALRDGEPEDGGEARIGPGHRIKDEQWLPPVVTLEEKVAAANVQARAEILAGYAYNGVTFSTSLESQMRWLGASLNPSAITFPFVVATVDDRGTYEVKSPEELAVIAQGMTRGIFAAHQRGVTAKARITREGVLDGKLAELAQAAEASTLKTKV